MSTDQPDGPLVAGRFPLAPRTFTTRAAETTERLIVDHPGGVVVLPMLDDGHVVMIHNRRPALDTELLELPAGTLEPPESPADCARRELAEETGYRAETLRRLGWFYTCPGFCNERLYAFVAQQLTASRPSLEDAEDIRVEVLSLPRALDMIADGGITDAKTIATLLMYHQKHGRRP